MPLAMALIAVTHYFAATLDAAADAISRLRLPAASSPFSQMFIAASHAALLMRVYGHADAYADATPPCCPMFRMPPL